MSTPLVKQWAADVFTQDLSKIYVTQKAFIEVYLAADVEQRDKDLVERLGMMIRYLANGRFVQAQGLVENTRNALLARRVK